MKEHLPSRPRSHVLETLSRAFFTQCVPPEWIIRDVSSDYGLDLNVEIVDTGKVTGKNFSVQLKSATSPLPESNSAKVRIKRSTLQYMRARPEPVMVVLYSAQNKDAAWIWVHDIPITDEEDTRTFTISLPPCQRLRETRWESIRGFVYSFYSSRPTVDRDTASKLERFGRYSIDLSRTPILLKEEVDAFETLINDDATKERDLQSFIEMHPEVFLGGEYVRLHAQLPLQEFEDLINDPEAKEKDFQDFLAAHPMLLTSTAKLSKVHDEFKIPRTGNVLIPDFFVESVNGLSDILDLKRPMDRIVVRSKNRSRYGVNVSNGVAQVQEYARFFDDVRGRTWFERRYGLRVYRPLCMLIIGRDSEFKDVYEKRALEDRIGNVRLITYDDLLRMARFRQVA